MTYNTASYVAQVPTACTCANCRQFDDFNEQRGRGLCKVFDQVTYRHHSLTQDCLTSLPETEDESELPEEDRLYCKYQPGDTVKLIDSDKDHIDWESFTVVGHNTKSDCQSRFIIMRKIIKSQQCQKKLI